MQNDSYQPYPEQPNQPEQQNTPQQEPSNWQPPQGSNTPAQPFATRPQFPANAKPPKGNGSKNVIIKALGILGVVVLVLVALVGGYVLRDQTGKIATTPIKTTTKDTPHTVTAVGYPGGTTNVITTKLAFDSGLQAIENPTNRANPGIISQFSNTNTDEMGRWMVGNPDDTVGGSVGDITLINLNRATYFQIPVPKGFNPIKQSPGYELQIANTPFAKSSALKSYIARIATCAADQDTGMVISDFMNICVTPEVIPSNTNNSFHSQAIVEGYGKSNGIELLMLGTINLETSAELTPAQQKRLADDYQAATTKATQDNSTTPTLPDYVTKRTDTYRAALTYSTIDINNTAK